MCHTLFSSLVSQVVSAESQSEQPQGICAHIVPSPENQTFPDTTGMLFSEMCDMSVLLFIQDNFHIFASEGKTLKGISEFKK